MIQSKKIILCADDFGLNTKVSQAILKLVAMERLSAVSCMTNMPFFKIHAKELSTFYPHVQMGLHFNLTEGHFLSKPDKACFSLNELLLKSHFRCISSAFIEREFKAQLAAYVDAMGRLPDFIDGHQHVHQFPKIRAVILRVYEAQLRANNLYIRATAPALYLPKYQFKSRILALTGGRALACALNQRNIPHNAYFSGVYDFSQELPYRTLFCQWLTMIQDNTLIMCHPGEGVDATDPIAVARQIEMDYISSSLFLEDCEKYSVSYSRRS